MVWIPLIFHSSYVEQALSAATVKEDLTNKVVITEFQYLSSIPQCELQYLRQVISSLALLPDLYIADYTLGHCSGLLYSDPAMTRYDMDNNTL